MHSEKHSWMWMQCERRNGIVNMHVRCPGTQSPYLPSTPCRVFAPKDTENVLFVVERLQLYAILESQANCSLCRTVWIYLLSISSTTSTFWIIRRTKANQNLIIYEIIFQCENMRASKNWTGLVERYRKILLRWKIWTYMDWGMHKKRVWRKNFDYATVTAQSTDNLYSN